jgi:hypothetical protein
MKRWLPVLISVCLAALVFTSAFAFTNAGNADEIPAGPTKPAGHPGQGHGHGNAGGPPGLTRGRGGPCGQPSQPGGAGEAGKLHYDGVLTGVGAASITISTTLSGTVTLNVTAATCIRRPPSKGVALSELTAGLRVQVQARPGAGGGNPEAVRIQVHKPRKATYVGTVTAYSPGTSLTLQPEAGGSPLTFAITAGTEIKPWHRADDLAVGSEVTAQVLRDFVGANPPALRITVHGAAGDDD